jgi:2,3-bisphosphoglycerate-independent phosphoglycerate mutase
VVLCILDGWGLRDDPTNNAVALARTPVWDRLRATCAAARISTSGADVGLPDGQMGNSEVGHMNIGAGRIAVPDLPRIDAAIADGTLAGNAVLQAGLARLKASGGTLHLIGLLSPGGIHSHQDHLVALARLAAGGGVKVAVHALLDGRDAPPQSALGYLADFERAIAGAPDIRIATVGGRYFGMDRDKRWERVAQAYAAIVEGKGAGASDAAGAVRQAYAAGETDEFVTPTVIGDYAGMRDGDGLLMANFRADRARQILTALLEPHFDGFARGRTVRFAAALGMVEYSAQLNERLDTLFAPVRLAKTLGELVSAAGMTQLRIAETEKYAHVTFFLNGGEERVFAGEDRILVPSPKVKTYDLQPEMSAPEVTDMLVAAIASGKYDLIVVNYANPDMVGHTGILAAAIRAAECVDGCLGRVEAAVAAAGGVLFVTADHGNLEEMRDPASGQPHTQHTTNLVPAILVGPGAASYRLVDGRLADIAPTLLHFLGIAQPAEMTGRSLLRPASDESAAKRRARA